MPDEDALLAAVAAAPDDDLPRLVFADWLDESGDPDRAEFVRAQVRLAATDPWEPFAVLGRHRRPEWVRGDRWRGTLPRVDGDALRWHPDRAFRRGFGYSLIVRDVRWLLEEAPRLFAEAPVGELHLPTATLEEWRAFARADWLPRVRAIHFYGTTTPIEPVRELCASPRATGIEEVVFEKASGAGLPVLLEDMLRSPLGRQLRRLDLRVGPDEPEPLYEAIAGGGDLPRLRSLSLTTMTTSVDGPDGLYVMPSFSRLSELELTHVVNAGLPWLSEDSILPHLERFAARRCGLGFGREPLRQAGSVAILDLSDNALGWRGDASRMAWTPAVPSLKSVNLRRTMFRAAMLRPLTQAAFWPNLIELDLRDNRITDVGAAHLMSAPPPPNLTALLLAGNRLSDGARGRLRAHFGDALILTQDGAT